MKTINKILIFILVSTIISSSSFIDGGKKEKLLLKVLIGTLKNGHFVSLSIDDNFSEKVFKNYLEKLDYSKRFLLKSDMDNLNIFRTKIDDEINNSNYSFFNISVDIIKQRIKNTKAFYEEILSKPFDYSINETYETAAKKKEYSKDLDELKERWRKILKYETIQNLNISVGKKEDAIADNNKSYKIKTFEELEKESRKKVLKTYNDWFRRLSKIKIKDRRSTYLNSITSSFDPHTTYLLPKEKENFDIRISGQLEGIGAQLIESNGYIKVTRIIPGSASWKQGELKEGAIILKVAQKDKEPVSIVDMRLDEAVKLIRGKKGSEVRLTVKKIDGNIYTIPIIRDIVVLEETFAKSALIKKNKKNYGYIYLPKFYVNFKNSKARHCSKDVEIEINKLKAENPHGIILDLRNNGGGSLRDVVEMAGLFIKKGPIVQIKSRNGSPYLLKDEDEQVHYDGPLIILVNTFSASASEILAAAMQDYNRAIIIGSPTTYGKGTVQRIISFDRIIGRRYDDLKPFGAMKLTTQKFYRINGGTTQLKGVVPDVILPDMYSYIKVGEKELDNAITWTEIPPAQYDKWKTKPNYDKIKRMSKKRLNKNKSFKLIEKNAKRMKMLKNKTKYTLNFKKYRKRKVAESAKANKYKNIMKTETGLNISILKADYATIKNDSTKSAGMNAWIVKLKKDVYINEVVSVFQELK